ncbi:putative RNA-directed DNA polymerase [Aphis craccivora]|uniref:Putative RNA-directed DNA polymerase n=1 Tax=Aphis craccivora TaxID=307492 RepID=A0A6G0YM72_APHCR|nr:putative RNA-directed DNA polymerase [Aphis craccivora]
MVRYITLPLATFDKLKCPTEISQFCWFYLRIQHPPHDYSPISNTLNIKSFAKRRHSKGLKLFNGLLSRKIDSPFLLNLFNFKVPQRTF